MTHREMANEYKARFGRELRFRLSELSFNYPNGGSICWEGSELTGCETIDQVRVLLKTMPLSK